jgi:hypothetical protein
MSQYFDEVTNIVDVSTNYKKTHENVLCKKNPKQTKIAQNFMATKQCEFLFVKL